MRIPYFPISIEKAWKIMLIWFIVVILALAAAREWGVVVFGLTYGILFGGIAYHFRHRARHFLRRMGFYDYRGFLFLSVIVTVTEETYCYLLGNRIANPVLWIDLVLVTTMWTVWFGTWYFYLSKKYIFSEKEALMTAAATGIFYEYIGTGYIFQNPAGIVLSVPLAMVIYAAIFILPMQLIEFRGTENSILKYPVGVVLPFILTIPVAFTLWVLFSLAGHPLE